MLFLIQIQRRTQYHGETGFSGYRKYKREICDDCQHRCVYCDLHANLLGGYDMMELDHFRPKKKDLYPELKFDPFNLLLACRSCNSKKRDDWPAGRDTACHVNGIGYVDPFDNRAEYFEVSAAGRMVSKKAPAQYVIDQLALNRPLAVSVRGKRSLLHKLKAAAEKLQQEQMMILNSANDIDRVRLKQIVELLGQIQVKLFEMCSEEGCAL